MRDLVLLAIISIFCLPVFGQETNADKDAAYTKTITARSEKIVAALVLNDASKAKRVCETITNQYRNLNKIYTKRDEAIKRLKEIKSENDFEKSIIDSSVKREEEYAWKEARKLHEPFINALAKDLNKDQITEVKNGMTYNVLNVTYKAMLEMIPSLKSNEKEQIMTWLVEARELAMDAESSDKKHWWFGKYKGRINNYLAIQGYDLQKERKDWEERLKAAKEQKTTTNQ